MDRGALGQAVSMEVLLARQAAAGDVETALFRSLFEQELAYVLRTLRRLSIPSADAEDLAHEVFVAVYRRRSELDPGRPPRPWLFAFCVRVAANHRRAEKRSRAFASVAEPADAPADGEEALSRGEDRRIVLQALEVLDLDKRACFVLHCLDGIAIPEVASSLGIPTGTAYTRLRAAKQIFTREVRRLSGVKGEAT